jgi:NAD(P)-dependent dehydrogenase (short-subunit alcohol dehydrogenase family)
VFDPLLHSTFTRWPAVEGSALDCAAPSIRVNVLAAGLIRTLMTGASVRKRSEFRFIV